MKNKDFEARKLEFEEKFKMVSDSIDFWGKEMDKVFAEFEAWEEQEDHPDFEAKMEEFIVKLESLIARGEQEELIVTQLENEFNDLMLGKTTPKVEKKTIKEDFLSQLRQLRDEYKKT